MSERLWPSLGFFLSLFLIIPAMTVLFFPQSFELGLIIGICSYVALVALFLLMSRHIEVKGTTLKAGNASIDVKHLGEMTALDPHNLKIAIGHRADARAFLMVSGWVKTGVKIMVEDPADPTPYWIVTTRKPDELIAAITRAKESVTQ